MSLFEFTREFARASCLRITKTLRSPVLWTLICIAPLLPVFGQDVPVPESDLVHYGDLIDLDVDGGFEFDWRGTLTPEGFLDGFNSFGDPILGLCRTESDIATDIVKAYSKFLREPKVTVKIVDRSNRAVVTLNGAVRYPQRFQLRRTASLLELLVLSGGITDEAGGEIRIFRPRHLSCEVQSAAGTDKALAADVGAKSNDSQMTVITVADLLKGTASANPAMRSGDLITVERAVPIYVIGGVKTPRQISARTNMTLSRAVASAGGLSKEADSRQITIFRREGGVASVIEADLEKIAAGGAADPELKAYDVIEVTQKGRRRSTYPPIVKSQQSSASLSLPLRIIE